MKITFGRIACSLVGSALVASSWLAFSHAQDLRLKNQPTLAAPQRSSVELRTAPTYSAQKQTTTPTGSLPAGSTPVRTITPQPAPATSNYSPNPPSPMPGNAIPAATSKWAPVAASAPLTATADPVSTPIAVRPAATSETPLRLSVGTLSPTPEMWFYEQMRQDANNPEVIVRRRAEQAAAERKAMIAAREWYGVSLSRPTAHVTPFTYHYSPTWVSNARHPYHWTAPRVAPQIIIEASRPYVGVSGFGSW